MSVPLRAEDDAGQPPMSAAATDLGATNSVGITDDIVERSTVTADSQITPRGVRDVTATERSKPAVVSVP